MKTNLLLFFLCWFHILNMLLSVVLCSFGGEISDQTLHLGVRPDTRWDNQISVSTTITLTTGTTTTTAAVPFSDCNDNYSTTAAAINSMHHYYCCWNYYCQHCQTCGTISWPHLVSERNSLSHKLTFWHLLYCFFTEFLLYQKVQKQGTVSGWKK